MNKLGTTTTVLIAVLALAVAAMAGALIATAATDDEPNAMTSGTHDTTLDGDRGGFDRDDPYTDPDERPIPKDQARRVADAAIASLGGGTVVEISRSDDPGETWEVEVMTPDRGEVDVALDAALRRVPNAAYED